MYIYENKTIIPYLWLSLKDLENIHLSILFCFPRHVANNQHQEAKFQHQAKKTSGLQPSLAPLMGKGSTHTSLNWGPTTITRGENVSNFKHAMPIFFWTSWP